MSSSQGVKTLKNNAIIMTVIILMGHVERKPDIAAFENQHTHPRSLISASVVRFWKV